jgi:hypothetical protein
MPTKLRIIVQKKGHKPIKGPRAISFLVKTIQSRVLNMLWPPGWDTLSTRNKLEFLAKFLPSDTQLLLIREGKWTRRSRSLYSNILNKNKREMADDDYMDEEAPMRIPRPMQYEVQGRLGR